jgi:hypothetical protein
MDVAKVDQGMLHMLHMLQVFQKHVASVCSKCFICFQMYVAIIFYLNVAYVFTHMLQQYVPNVSPVLVLYHSKCFFMLQLFYLDVAYVSHTCFMRMYQMFHLFQMYVAFECFILQVQTVGLGAHEGRQGPSRGHQRVEEAQAAVGIVGRRHKPHSAIMEEAGRVF